MDFFGSPGQPKLLSPKHGFPDRERLRLQRFLTGLRVLTDAGGNRALRPIRKLSAQGAADMRFALRDGGNKTVAVCSELSFVICQLAAKYCMQSYFKETYNVRLEQPDIICVEVRISAWFKFISDVYF